MPYRRNNSKFFVYYGLPFSLQIALSARWYSHLFLFNHRLKQTLEATTENQLQHNEILELELFHQPNFTDKK